MSFNVTNFCCFFYESFHLLTVFLTDQLRIQLSSTYQQKYAAAEKKLCKIVYQYCQASSEAEVLVLTVIKLQYYLYIDI